MTKFVLAQPKGYPLARHKITSLFLSFSFALTSISTTALQCQAQVPVGLGISLGSMLVSGMVSAHTRHENKKINVKNKAINACNRGVKLLDQKQYEEALDAFSEALNIDPNLNEAHWNSAIAYKKLGDYSHCLAETQQVLGTQSADAETFFMAALASQHLHHFAQADQYYQRYLAMDKSGENAEFADRATKIIEHVFLSAPDGDYIADATKGGVERWADNKMPLKVFIQEDQSVLGYKPEFAVALKQAFTDWSDISDGKISFVYVDKQSEAQINCGWTSDKLQLGGTKELGLTHRESQDDKIVLAKIDLYTFVDRPELRTEDLIAAAKQVDLHEIGHALGLEHSQQPYDIMYFETTPDGLEFPLTPRDKSTILALYSAHTSQISQIPNGSAYFSVVSPASHCSSISRH